MANIHPNQQPSASQLVEPPVFNSLGSNYSRSFARRVLKAFLIPNKKNQRSARQHIVSQLGADVQWTYKGREALWLLLEQWEFGSDDVVLTQAFGCYAIEWAITQVGAMPVFVDVEARQTNMSVRTLEKAWQDRQQPENTRIKPKIAVIVQHGVGHRTSLTPFRQWCDDHHAFLIEDLAQGFSLTQLSKDWHSIADGIIYSFGQDKCLDIGVGGAFLDQKKSNIDRTQVSRTQLLLVPRFEQFRTVLYPSISSLLRQWYGTVWHTLFFHFCKTIGMLRSPVKNLNSTPAKFPHWLFIPLAFQLNHLSSDLTHRQQIAEIYNHSLSKWAITTDESTEKSSNLRFTLWVSDPKEFVAYMRQHQVLISDRWYRQPSDSGSLGYQSQYQPGSCLQTEELCQHCVNLPTHRQVSVNQAYQIGQLAKSWLMTHDQESSHSVQQPRHPELDSGSQPSNSGSPQVVRDAELNSA